MKRAQFHRKAEPLYNCCPVNMNYESERAWTAIFQTLKDQSY